VNPPQTNPGDNDVVPMALRRAGVAIVVVLAVLARAGASDRPPVGACVYEVVRPDDGDRGAAFRGWLKAHAETLGDSAYLMDEGTGHPLEVLIADIDNDGADEYMLASWEGSGHYLSLWVFRRTGKEWAAVTPTPLDAPLAGAREYRGPRMDGSHLLARFCGKTYVNLMGGAVPNYFPESYLWERGALHPACDTPWLNHQRHEFQGLFDQAFYDEAHLLLDGVQGRCASAADAETWLWIQSDLALTAYRMKTYGDGLEHVAAAERSGAFAHASTAVKKAIAANAELCRAARRKGLHGDPAYDFSWLLKAPPRTQIVMDPRFDGLLSAIAPEARFGDGQPLRDALKLGVWLAEPPALVEGRYLLIAGCEPHNCGNRGFIWIDTVARKAILSTEDTLASTTVDAAHIPEAFWKQAPVPPGLNLDYIGPDGEKVQVEIPAHAAD
jgi:hypothetical protein